MKVYALAVVLIIGVPILCDGSKNCDGIGDLLFLLDSSTSVGPESFKKQKQFINDIISSIRVGPRHIRVALVTFNTFPRLGFNFNHYTNKRDVMRAVKKIRFTEGVTFLGKALRFTRENFGRAFRKNTRKLVIMITDGKPNGPLDVVAESQKLKALGVRIISIGVTKDINSSILRKLSTKHTYYTLKNVDQLKHILKNVQFKTCRALIPPRRCSTHPADFIFVLDSSTSVGIDNWKREQKFITDLIKPFKFGPKKSRVAFLTYNTESKIVFNIDQLTSYRAIRAAIHAAKFTEGTTFTGEALQKVLDKIVPKLRGSNIAKILILITDGKSNGFEKPVVVAKKLKQKGIKIITIGVTANIDKGELKQLSSTGHVYVAPKFESLTKLVSSLRRKECDYTRTPRRLPKPKPKKPKPEPPVKCFGNKVDMVFVLDSSSSVGPHNWKKELEFITMLTDSFRVSTGEARFALVTYNTQATLNFNFNAAKSKAALHKAIKLATFSEGLTFTGEALRLVKTSILPTYRSDARKLLFLVTDGKSNGLVDPIGVASSLKKSGVTIFSIGITNAIKKSELRTISSSGCMYKVTDQKELRRLVPAVDRKLCKEIRKPPPKVHKVVIKKPKPRPPPKKIVPPKPKKPTCSHDPVDLVLVLDSSTSVGEENWEKQKKFLLELIKPFNVARGHSRIALITFNTQAKLVFNVDKYTSYHSIKNVIKGLKFTEGLTFTGQALNVVLNDISPKLNRPKVPKLLILITDGKSNGFNNPVKVAAKLKKKGIFIITVGISKGIDKRELNKISSEGKTVKVEKFGELKKIVNTMRKKECALAKKK